MFFFLILLLTLTLIYVSLINTSIKIEFFTNPDDISNNPSAISIAKKLDLNLSRIHNFKEIGDITKTDEYQIYFEVYPRTVVESSAPTIKNIKDTLQSMIINKDAFDVKSSNGSDVFLAKITVEEADRPIPGRINDKKIISQFIDPSIDGQIKYLKYKKTGVPEEPEMDPRYKFEGAGLVLEPIPIPMSTTIPTPEPTNIPMPPTTQTASPTPYV